MLILTGKMTGRRRSPLEKYEELKLEVVEFDTVDVIAYSGEEG